MSAWSKIWKYVVYLRPALRIECHGDHLWRTVNRSLPRLTGALLRALLCLRHGAFWGCAPAPLTKLDLIDWLIDCDGHGRPNAISTRSWRVLIHCQWNHSYGISRPFSPHLGLKRKSCDIFTCLYTVFMFTVLYDVHKDNSNLASPLWGLKLGVSGL